MTAFIRQDKLFRALLFIITSLFILNLVSIFIFAEIDTAVFRNLRRIFDFDVEGNIPTMFSTLLWLISGSLLYLVSRIEIPKYRIHWLLLALVFIYLGIDDGVELHEKLSAPIKELINTSGYLTFGWIIPYTTILLLMSLLYFRFLTQLPRSTMIQFTLAGVIFLSGAIGLEILSGPFYSEIGEQSTVFKLFYSFEEVLEMIGMALFIRALINHLTGQQKSLSIQFK